MDSSGSRERSPAADAVAHYETLLQRHGPVPNGVGWNSEQAQTLRFERLLEILPAGDTGFSLLDFGCGFGALADFLAERRTGFLYVGYDASLEMIACARSQVRYPRAQFESDWNAVPRCDFAVASGVFNVRGDWPDERWLRYILDTLATMDARVTTAWSANFLTSYSDPERMRPELYYADPLVLFDWCKRNLSPWVALHHDDPLFDFTILVRKEPLR